MNILMIGNGFDLAHGLPTKYGDFLKWIEITRKIIDEDYTLKEADWKDIDSQIRLLMEEKSNNAPFYFFEDWKNLINNNVLIDYFLQGETYQKRSWVDFETELSNLVQVLEILEEKIDEGEMFSNLKKSQEKILVQLFPQYSYNCTRKIVLETLESIEPISNISNWEEILAFLGIDKKINRINISRILQMFGDMNNYRNNLEKDLNNLIILLEKYLHFICMRLKIDKYSPDIESIDADKVVSFNYIDIYKNIYDKKNREIEVDYDYINGKAQEYKESNNMVLGINEYLTTDKKNCDIKFIAFKKYYQRIYKGTGNKHKDWTDKIRENEKWFKKELKKEFPTQIPINKFNVKDRHNLYIFGHSLDVTEKDILKNLILQDSVYTTIYYHKTYDDIGKDDNGRKDLGLKIANLVKVIGQDELIRRTGGSTKTIEFKLQQDMVEI